MKIFIKILGRSGRFTTLIGSVERQLREPEVLDNRGNAFRVSQSEGKKCSQEHEGCLHRRDIPVSVPRVSIEWFPSELYFRTGPNSIRFVGAIDSIQLEHDGFFAVQQNMINICRDLDNGGRARVMRALLRVLANRTHFPNGVANRVSLTINYMV